MTRTLQLVIIAGAALAASVVARADDCEFTAQRQGKIDIGDATKISITARAGEFELVGVKGAKEISGSGRACASSQAWLDEIQIHTRREGDTVFLNVGIPDTDKVKVSWGNNYATLDLKVTVPDNIAVTAIDSSGEASVSNLASLDMTDSSGELRITDIAGDLIVRDSSGELRIKNVGSVKLNDSSGDIEIDGVAKDVHVEVDSSGSMDIERVKGNVIIDQDSSGDIEIADVGGEVRIDTDSSGGVSVRRVEGGFSLGRKSSGDVQTADVKGAVNIPNR